MASVSCQPEVSIIVPARNEEACLAGCLTSLVGQADVDFELIVVDDHSSDRTRQIAQSFPAAAVVAADPLPEGWCGKQNALHTGVRRAHGDWLLFTDADTVHAPGSLRRALNEAQHWDAALLSYSPEQEAHTLWERAIMPVIFAELASAYPPSQVCDPQSPVAAANGQYLLMRRTAYDAVGGHAAFAGSLLEDVELARAVKRNGERIRFRLVRGEVRTRMYRSFRAMCEGWSKNLTLLFPRAATLGILRLGEFLVIVAGGGMVIAGATTHNWPLALSAAAVEIAVYANFWRRLRRAHFGIFANLLSIFGLPVFSILLLRSAIYYKWRRPIAWRGRYYTPAAASPSRSTVL